MVIRYRIYEQGEEVLLAACDSELLGKTLEDGEIHMVVKESFYGGESIEPHELAENFDRTTIANLVGEETVKTALEKGFGWKEDVLYINEVPHLQIVRM
ncbi:MAG: DUF424 family protein [Thermoplasmata archaeon]